MVCSGMVIRKGSGPHPSGAFKCWVKPDWVFPACLAWGHLGLSREHSPISVPEALESFQAVALLYKDACGRQAS